MMAVTRNVILIFPDMDVKTDMMITTEETETAKPVDVKRNKMCNKKPERQICPSGFVLTILFNKT